MRSFLLTRPEGGRVLGGVCAALAERWGIEVNLLRLAFALLALASGVGVVLYLALWLMWPSASGEPGGLWAVVRGNASELGGAGERAIRRALAAWTRTNRDTSPWPRSRRWIGIALVVAGGWLFLRGLGMFSWLGLGTSIGLGGALVGLALLKSLATPGDTEVRR